LSKKQIVKNPIKLLVIPSWYPPDGGYFFKEHSESLAGEGCAVDVLYNRVIGLRKFKSIPSGELGSFRVNSENGIRVIRSGFFKFPGNEPLNARRWISSTSGLFRRYQRKFGKPDLILAHSGIWAGCAAEKISRESGIPYIIAEHRSFLVFSTEESKQQLSPLYRKMVAPAYRNASRLIAVSESMKPGLLEIEPEAGEKITVVPNMVNGDFFSFTETPRSSDPFVFLSAGRLVKFKGLDYLMRAFAELKKNTRIPVRLKIVGRGEEGEKLENLAAELGISQDVEFTGRLSREQVVRAYQESNCFVLPSLYEAFGVVLIEAMATGLPVIATRSGGPEYIVEESSGYLIEPGNVDVLRNAMAEMIQNYDSFDSDAIRESTLFRYGNHEIAREYIEIFKICLNLHR
jgi:glycosyltransferase involved in cell wall biosynthesis